MAILFDITVSAKHGEVTLYGLPLGAVGERAAAVAAQLECGFLPEQVVASRLEDVRVESMRPVVPGSIEDAAAKPEREGGHGAFEVTVTGEQARAILQYRARVTPPAKAIYTNAQFDALNVCGARNIEDGTRCASLKKHRGVHAWRMVSDGPQPVPANNLEASTG